MFFQYGCLVQFVVCVIYRLQMKLSLSLIATFISLLISILIGLLLQFFCFNLDYTRTERVQFEDDEYYYYVKAVPKITVAKPAKTVKQITSQRRGSAVPPHAVHTTVKRKKQ